MSIRVPYSASTAFGQQVAEYVDSVIKTRDQGRRLRAAFDAMASGGSYDQIETEIGGMTAGDGQTLYNLLVGTVAALEAAGFNELSRLDQG